MRNSCSSGGGRKSWPRNNTWDCTIVGKEGVSSPMSRKNVGENWNFATTRCNNIFTSAYKVSFRFTRKDRGTIEHDLRILKGVEIVSRLWWNWSRGKGFASVCRAVPKGKLYRTCRGLPFVGLKHADEPGHPLRSPSLWESDTRIRDIRARVHGD